MTVATNETKRMPRPAPEPDTDTYLGRLAAHLIALRKEAGLEADDAVAAITKAGYQITTSSLYRWERGDSQPHAEAYPAIAKAYRLKSTRLILPNE